MFGKLLGLIGTAIFAAAAAVEIRKRILKRRDIEAREAGSESDGGDGAKADDASAIGDGGDLDDESDERADGGDPEKDEDSDGAAPADEDDESGGQP